MARIMVSFDKLLSVRQRIDALAERYSEDNKEMAAIIEELKNSWEGEDAEEFINSVSPITEYSGSIIEVLNAMEQTIDYALKAYSEAEQQTADNLLKD